MFSIIKVSEALIRPLCGMVKVSSVVFRVTMLVFRCMKCLLPRVGIRLKTRV